MNPAAFRFCGACGAALVASAAAGPAPDPRAYTPKHLAEKILKARSALEGERKQVTVLFADVKSSLELAESVDAEEWHRVLDGFFSVLAEGRSDRRRLVVLHLNFGAVLGLVRGEEALRLQYTREAVRLAREIGDARTELASQAQLVAVEIAHGRLAEAVALADEVQAHPEDHDLRGWAFGSPRTVARQWRALALAYLGRLGDGRRDLESLETIPKGDFAFGAVLIWPEVAWLMGDAASATSSARLQIEHCERTGNRGARVGALARLGAAHSLRREWPEAIGVLEQALDAARELRLASETEALTHLALARLGAGETRKARETAVEAVALAVKRGARLREPYARIVFARVLMQSDGAAARPAIEAELDRADALIHEMGARALAPLVLEERARLAHLLGDERGCERGLREAQQLFAEIGATGHAERLAEELREARP